MWTADNRPRYNRDKLRYGRDGDLTDAEWAHIEPLIPPGKPGGGKRRVEGYPRVINGGAMPHSRCTGCQWRALPKDLPPRSTVHDFQRHLGLWLTRDGLSLDSHPSCALWSTKPRGKPRRSQPHGLHHRQSECEKR